MHDALPACSNSHFGYLRGKQPQSRVVTVPEFPGSAAILAAFGAGETPALPGKSAPRCDVGRVPLQNENCWYGSDIFPLRGLVNPLLEAEDMSLHFLPRDVLPGHLQGQALCFGTLPLTHGFTFQHTGPTSAYPGHYPRPLLLRASCAPAASGWRLLRRGTCSTEGCWR